MSTVTSAIELIGLSKLAREFDYYPSAIQKWRDDGRLPRTDLAGLTNYAGVIAKLSKQTSRPVTAEQLLDDTRTAWEARPAGKPGARKAKGLRASKVA